MAVTPAIDLTAEHHRTVLALLNHHLPNTAVWAYGSRVKWTSHPASDLDLVAFAKPSQAARVSELREAFDESNLPFRVDLFVWDDVPESFHKRIEAEYVVLAKQERPVRKNRKGWPRVTLGNCIEMSDATYSPREKWPFVNYLDTSNITENRIGEIQHLIPGKDKIPSRARRKAQPGDILYSTVRPNQRHFGLLKKVPENFLASTGFSVMRGKEDCARTEFIYWFLAQDYVVEHLQTIAEHSTSAYPSIRPADIERLTLNLPPLSEQRAIARILGALDDKIELNRRMAATAEESVRALFKSWFVDFDPVRARMEGGDVGLPPDMAALFPDQLVQSGPDKVPKGWRIGTLGDIASLNRECWNAQNAPERLSYVDLANTKWGHIQTVETCPWKSAPSRARRVLHPGDTIVGTVRPGNGSFALVGRPGLTGSTAFAALSPKASIDREIVWCVATSQDNLDRLAHLADGGAYPAVNPRAVLATSFALPGARTRKAFSSITAPWLDRAENNRSEGRTLAALRDALLPRLVSGEIRVSDAEQAMEADV